MKYSVKWIEDNLGINRDQIKYYEEKELPIANVARNPVNNYREYSEDDVAELWGYKILQGIGFKVNEIKEIVEENVDFYDALTNKIEEFEKNKAEINEFIEYAKTIKILGRIPTTEQIGRVKYTDFLEHCKKQWNIFANPAIKPYADAMDLMYTGKKEDIDIDELSGMIEVLAEYKSTALSCTLDAYYRVISELNYLGYADNVIQTIVKLIYEYVVQYIKEDDITLNLSKQDFAKQFSLSFLVGDLSLERERQYGKSNCEFIAKALAYFGGIDALSTDEDFTFVYEDDMDVR